MAYVGMDEPIYTTGGIVVGGKYKRKGKTDAQNKASFIKLFRKLGYTKDMAEQNWKLEEQRERIIGTVKPNYETVAEYEKRTGVKVGAKKRKVNKRAKWMGIFMKEGLSMKEASDKYNKVKAQLKKPLPAIPTGKPQKKRGRPRKVKN